MTRLILRKLRTAVARVFLVCAVGFGTLSGCAHRPSNLGPQATNSTGFVIAEDRLVRISAIDGKEIRPVDRAELTAGEHTLSAHYITTSEAIAPKYTFQLKIEAGRTYLIKGGIKGRGLGSVIWDEVLQEKIPPLVRLWIVDAVSKEEPATVLESRWEPVDSGTPVGLPGFFTWSSPLHGKRMALFRYKDGLSVGWKGDGSSESYSVNIRVYDLPNLKGASDFVEHVRNSRLLPAARHGNLEGSIEILSGGTDFCVKYHQAIVKEIQAPVGGGDLLTVLTSLVISSMRTTKVLVESYGYSCRIPNQKRFGIDFKYSHESTKEKKDLTMAEQADEFFNRLKF